MNEYRDIRASLLRFMTGFATERNSFGANLKAVNMEAYANPTEWPEGDFIGLAEFQMMVEGSFVVPAMAFVISTRDDENLFRMDDLINRLLGELIPGRHIVIVDAVSGTPRGRMHVLDQTRVGTVEHTDSQPARPIMVTFKSDQTLKLT